MVFCSLLSSLTSSSPSRSSRDILHSESTMEINTLTQPREHSVDYSLGSKEPGEEETSAAVPRSFEHIDVSAFAELDDFTYYDSDSNTSTSPTLQETSSSLVQSDPSTFKLLELGTPSHLSPELEDSNAKLDDTASRVSLSHQSNGFDGLSRPEDSASLGHADTSLLDPSNQENTSLPLSESERVDASNSLGLEDTSFKLGSATDAVFLVPENVESSPPLELDGPPSLPLEEPSQFVVPKQDDASPSTCPTLEDTGSSALSKPEDIPLPSSPRPEEPSPSAISELPSIEYACEPLFEDTCSSSTVTNIEDASSAAAARVLETAESSTPVEPAVSVSTAPPELKDSHFSTPSDRGPSAIPTPEDSRTFETSTLEEISPPSAPDNDGPSAPQLEDPPTSIPSGMEDTNSSLHVPDNIHCAVSGTEDLDASSGSPELENTSSSADSKPDDTSSSSRLPALEINDLAENSESGGSSGSDHSGHSSPLELGDSTISSFFSELEDTAAATTPALEKPSSPTAQPDGSTTATFPEPENATTSASLLTSILSDLAHPDETDATARHILAIITSYSPNSYNSGGETSSTEPPFLALIKSQVTVRQPVQMVIPAFPMKSPNRTSKVLGRLPDLGEELALRHLDGLCANIRDVYPPGAEVWVQSDGLVYNDLLGVSDGDVFDYGETLREMAGQLRLGSLRFSRVSELLGHSSLGSDEEDGYAGSWEARREKYLEQAPRLREELLGNYKVADFDIDAAIRKEEDTCLTYRGYLKFLSRDLVDDARVVEARKTSNKAADRVVGQVAREMLVRGKAFAAAIRERFPACVRLSIHESTGRRKISVGLIPLPRPAEPEAEADNGSGDGQKGSLKPRRGRLGPTPWHSAVAVGLDGNYRSVAADEVRDTHDLIYHHGRPYYYREKSALFDWPFPVTFSPQYPCGLIITPDLATSTTSPPPSLSQIPMSNLRLLAPKFSPLVLRGFSETLQEPLFISKSEELGTICPWTFGIIQKVKDVGGERNASTSNVTTNEAMPFHYDGVFKFEERPNHETGTLERVSCPPLFQVFTCHDNTVPHGQGFTLFASSRLALQYMPPQYPLSRLRNVTWTLRSEGFWSAVMGNLPLVVAHPVDGSPCLRWHQPWDASRSQIATSTVTVETDVQEINDEIEKLMYDRRVCLYFTWERGDLLVNDNVSMHHTRTAYQSGWERELWRIHVD